MLCSLDGNRIMIIKLTPTHVGTVEFYFSVRKKSNAMYNRPTIIVIIINKLNLILGGFKHFKPTVSVFI